MFRFLAIVLGLACAVSNAQAADPALLTVGAGIYDFIPDNNKSAEVRAQYRFARGIGDTGTGEGFIGLKPLLGGMINTDEGVFGYFAFAAPYVWGEGKYEIEPSVGIGAYSRGDSAPLGGVAQFHLGLGFSAQVTETGRLGVLLAHISNGHILHDYNPGTNSLLLTWSWAFAGL